MEELNITVENGIKTLEVLTGKALEPKEPRKVTVSGVIDSPLRWLEKRVAVIDQKQSHITVDRDEMTIQLVINEQDNYATIITGRLESHPVFVKFGINSGKYRTPLEMSELFKMNRAYFANRQEAMTLVSLLRNFQAKVNKDVEAEFNPNKGDKRMLVAQKVESNLPPSFHVRMPLFNGGDVKVIEVETYFNPDDLTCTLVSAEASELCTDIKDSVIDKILEDIRRIAPDIAIIEI